MTYLDRLVSVEPLGSEEDTTDVLGCTANERLNVEYPAPRWLCRDLELARNRL
jgi:hypothetical protein